MWAVEDEIVYLLSLVEIERDGSKILASSPT